MSQAANRAPLPPMNVAGRIDGLRRLLGSTGCDALLVTKIENVRYLTGFGGSSAMLLVGRNEALAVTDGRYQEEMAETLRAVAPDVRLEVGRVQAQHDALRRALRGRQRLAVEARHVSWAAKRELAALLDGTTLVPANDLVESLRRVKDPGELARIERAADIADIALAQVKERLRERVTEREFAAELELEMRRRGADGASFDTIVASGARAAKPHARPTDFTIAPGDLVVVDFGALVDGYHSDMTRTLCVGEPAGRNLQDMVDAVFAAQRAGVRAVRPGVRAEQVDEACRASLVEAGFGPAFLHGTGHGVGLEIHEAPAIAPESADILEEGAVVTVEPGVYVPGVGGVRIEDTVVVSPDGARPLTRSTKDLTL